MIDAALYKKAMASLPSGVTVITTLDDDGQGDYRAFFSPRHGGSFRECPAQAALDRPNTRQMAVAQAGFRHTLASQGCCSRGSPAGR